MAQKTVADVPHMLKMWDYEQNTESPEDVAASCTDPKYWRCPECGYAWSVPPKTRYRGSGKCPCHETNKAICKGVNDVLTMVKGLDAFLDENNDFDKIYTQGTSSTLRVNFKCDNCGKKWTAELRTQIKKDDAGGYVAVGCSHYINKTGKRKKSDVPLCSEVESIYKFWDDKNSLDLKTTRSNSTTMAHFVCKNCGYDWTREIRSQGRASAECKCCERLLVPRKGYSDVFTLVPESKRFYNFDKNKDIDIYSIFLKDSKTLINWKCPDCSHEWKACLADRLKGKKGEYRFVGCHECYLHGKERITPVSSMPKLIKFWNFKKNRERGLDPNLTSAYAEIPADWRCKECGYEWETLICTRTDSNGKCPYCEGKFKPVRKGFNDVLTLCPALKEIYDFDYNAKLGIDLDKEGIYSKKRAHFKCKKCKHEWNSSIENRIKKNADGTYTIADCPECSNKNHRQVPYSVEYPLLAQMYRYDLNPIPLDSIKGRKALCETQYHWTCLVCKDTFESTLESMLGSQKYQTKGCPYCSRSRLRKGESFGDLHPELMDEYAPNNTIDPFNVFPNNKEYVNWICRDCGHEWPASFAVRHNDGGKCPFCTGIRAIPGETSLKALYPNIAQLLSPRDEHDPDFMLPNTTSPHIWRCLECNNDYNATTYEMTNGYTCPYCNDRLVMPGINSFGDRYPELIAEMDEIANYLLPKTPYEVLASSNYKFWFTCQKDTKHKYPMSPRTRLMFQKRDREPCLYCRGQRRKLHHFVAGSKKP